MDKTTLGVAGAMSALLALPATGAGATANPTAVQKAQSFAELLEPIPNAVERLRIADAEEARSDARLTEAQYVHHHHHHAHVVVLVRRHHHHHHHHHHPVVVERVVRPVHPVVRAVRHVARPVRHVVRPRPVVVVVRHHHHHHHHHAVVVIRHHHHHHHDDDQ